MIQNIRQEAGSIVDLSEMARNIDSTEREQYRQPMEVTEIIEELIDGILRNYPDADIETSMPANDYVLATLYTMNGKLKLQTVISGRSESSVKDLKLLQKRGTVSGSEGYVRLTPKGWIMIRTGSKTQRTRSKKKGPTLWTSESIPTTVSEGPFLRLLVPRSE